MSDQIKNKIKSEEASKQLALQGLQGFFCRYRSSSSSSSEEKNRRLTRSILNSPDSISDLLTYVIETDDDAMHEDGFYKKDILNNIFSYIKEFEIDAYSNPFWKSKIDFIIGNSLSSNTIVKQSDLQRATYLLDAASLVPNYNWKSMFDTFYESYINSYNSWISESFRKVIKQYSDTDTESFKQFVEDDIFYSKKKPGYQARVVFYKHYVEKGLLTKKTARKIRSDGAEEASVAGVQALINSELYEDKTEMLLQFSDSRYSGVLQKLAEELPIHLLASIMGSDDYWVKRTIERRLMAQEEGESV